MAKTAKYIKGEKKIRRHSKYRTCIPICQQRKIDYFNKYIPPKIIPSKEYVLLEDLESERAYHYYKVRVKKPVEFAYFKAFVREFFHEVKKHLIENEAGVFLKDFGYFMVQQSLRKSLLITYHLCFIPIRKDLKMRSWSMDRSESKYVLTNKLHHQRNIGHRYKTALVLLQNLYGRHELEIPEKRNDNK
jgi:hypothetical protein